MKTKPVFPSMGGKLCVVAASGPSLTPEVAQKVRVAWQNGCHVIAVNDAYKLIPQADVLYAADVRWWRCHQEQLLGFTGRRMSCHSLSTQFVDDKSLVYESLRLELVEARVGGGFSESRHIHYGEQSNSGFHAVNLALIMGAGRVVMVGFDMRNVEGKTHFFGDHPESIRAPWVDYTGFIKAFPADDRVVNATPGSALSCYERVDLDEALQWDGGLCGHGSIPDASASRECAA